eukprot:7055188-Karenia_brevis.AAC.1
MRAQQCRATGGAVHGQWNTVAATGRAPMVESGERQNSYSPYPVNGGKASEFSVSDDDVYKADVW